MSVKVKKNNKVLAGGRTYKAGEIVLGLDEQEQKRLVKLGVCEWGPDIDDGGVDLPLSGLVGLALTVEQFAELKADEQKAKLKALEIEPASKEEERIAQYEEWLSEQVNDDDQV